MEGILAPYEVGHQAELHHDFQRLEQKQRFPSAQQTDLESPSSLVFTLL